MSSLSSCQLASGNHDATRERERPLGLAVPTPPRPCEIVASKIIQRQEQNSNDFPFCWEL